MMTTALTALTDLTGAQFSTYRIGGPIAEAYMPTTMEEAANVLCHIVERQIEDPTLTFTVLGWGGNTLIASAGIGGVTLITRKMVDVKPLGDGRFFMAAGVHLAKASKVALDAGLTGGEYMIGIPGTIGGAVRMNAGALGQETSSVIESVQVFDWKTASIQTWTPKQLAFAYRYSTIDPNQHVALGATLRFEPGDPAAVAEAMDKSVQFRKTHHPLEPNGGSVFRNPSTDPQFSVGRMIDSLGGKEWTEGGVRISPRHGNFIINVDNGTSLDVLRLMVQMKQEIKSHFGFDVYPENKFIGLATDEEQHLWKELTHGDTAHH